LVQKGGAIAFFVAFIFYAVWTMAVTVRIGWTGLPELHSPTNTAAPLYRVGAYAVPVISLLLVQFVRKRNPGARTFASAMWDLFTFMPRRFSPFAVGPDPERSVPELQGRILDHTVDSPTPRPLVLGVHGQASVLAFAALSPMTAEQVKRIALVTYGCPISTIYGQFLPAYFGPDQIALLRDKLVVSEDGLVGWRNFYRRTDPIGGPVFAETTTPENDTELADPFPGPVVDVARDPPAWVRVSGHQHYTDEPKVREWLKRARTLLDR
jgi:hypothetical protein